MPLAIEKFLVQETLSIKKAMQVIDKTGYCTAFVINNEGRLVGAISDGDIRKAILRGQDINLDIKSVMNENPVFLSQEDLTNQFIIEETVKQLKAKIKVALVIPIVDSNCRPIELAYCSELSQIKLAESAHYGPTQKVLIVGGAGFLGSVLIGKLLDQGYRVRVLDILLYGNESIQSYFGNRKFEFIKGDVRDISALTKSLADVDAVINLAAIVGDPASDLDPSSTITTNYLANKILAEACRYYQINRFIFASSCSVYGHNEEIVAEDTPVKPVSLYARSKIYSEKGILELVDENFSPTILRMATLYGYSPRMRFDLVVNTMTKDAVHKNEIIVHGGGTQWRSFLEVGDAAEIFVKCLKVPLGSIKGEIFNVGSERQNYQIRDIAQKIHKLVPHARLKIESGITDNRTYAVSFNKIKNKFGFIPKKDITKAVLEIKGALDAGLIDDVNHNKYYNDALLKGL